MFGKSKNFAFKLQHPEEYKTKEGTVSVTYPFGTNSSLGEFSVQLVPLTENAVQPPKVKVFLDINKQGLLDWPKASLIEYVKKEPKPEPKVEPKKEDTATTEKDKDTATKPDVANGDNTESKDASKPETESTED